MRKSKIIISLILCMILVLTLMTACTSSKLSEDFDENEVEKAVEQVISYLNNKDSQAILEISTVQMKKALTDEALEEIFETVSEGGVFKQIEEISIGGSKDKNSEEEYAVSVTKAKYENKKFTYTITFTKQMKIAGLYYR